SAHEVDYPPIREAHQAASLDSPAEVAAWRATALVASTPRSAASDASSSTDLGAHPPAGAPREAIESVILRRGSTRVFAREPIAREQLATILHVASRGFSSDFLPAGAAHTELYLIVHAVDGLSPGAYVYDRERAALLLLRAGDFRRDAGY